MSCLRMVIARPRIAQEPEKLQLSKPPQEMIIALHVCITGAIVCVASSIFWIGSDVGILGMDSDYFVSFVIVIVLTFSAEWVHFGIWGSL